MFIPDYTITELNLSSNNLNKLPDDIYKYVKLIKLDCHSNKLTSIDNLPPNLQILDCSFNKITKLDNLPINLKELYRIYNKLTNSLDNLPDNLEILC